MPGLEIMNRSVCFIVLAVGNIFHNCRHYNHYHKFTSENENILVKVLQQTVKACVTLCRFTSHAEPLIATRPQPFTRRSFTAKAVIAPSHP